MDPRKYTIASKPPVLAMPDFETVIVKGGIIILALLTVLRFIMYEV